MGIMIAVLAVSFCGESRADAAKKYVLGIRAGISNDTDAQYKAMFGGIAKIYSVSHSIEIEPRWYGSDGEFVAAIKKREPDAIFLYSYDQLAEIKQKYGYSVFLTLISFGRPKPKACIYVRKDNPAKTIADLRGVSMATYNFKCEYFLLRDLIGNRPEEFFGSLKPLANGVSTIYSLAMGESDTSFTYDITYEMMKKSNPGPVKKIRELACTKPFGSFPMLISPDAPPETTRVFEDFLFNVHKDAAYKQYWPLFNLYKLRFVPSTDADFQPIFDLFKKANAKNWAKDFVKWIRYTQE